MNMLRNQSAVVGSIDSPTPLNYDIISISEAFNKDSKRENALKSHVIKMIANPDSGSQFEQKIIKCFTKPGFGLFKTRIGQKLMGRGVTKFLLDKQYDVLAAVNNDKVLGTIAFQKYNSDIYAPIPGEATLKMFAANTNPLYQRQGITWYLHMALFDLAAKNEIKYVRIGENEPNSTLPRTDEQERITGLLKKMQDNLPLLDVDLNTNWVKVPSTWPLP